MPIITASSDKDSCTLPSSLHALRDAVTIGELSAIVKAIFNNKELRDLVLKTVADIIDSECSVLTQRSARSPFRSISVNEMKNFKWNNFIDILTVKAPTLYCVISKVVSHSDFRNRTKLDRAHYPGICMISAVLLKERNREMCGIQSIISLLLYYSRTEKQVFQFSF